MEGFVPLSRRFFGHFLWAEERSFSKAEAWIDLIQMAAFKSHGKLIGTTVVNVDRGGIVASERFLSVRWNWSRTKVRDFLELLQSFEMVSIKKDHGVSLITLCNFEQYNSDMFQEKPQKDQEGTTKEPQKDQAAFKKRPQKDQPAQGATSLFSMQCEDFANGHDSEKDQEKTTDDLEKVQKRTKENKENKENKEEPAQGCADPTNLVIPLTLNTPRFLGIWADWMEFRKSSKGRSKNWTRLFQKNLDWLAGYPEPVAISIVDYSLRNEYQGLFEPKTATPTVNQPGKQLSDAEILKNAIG